MLKECNSQSAIESNLSVSAKQFPTSRYSQYYLIKKGLLFCLVGLILVAFAMPVAAMDLDTKLNSFSQQSTSSSDTLPALPESFFFSSGAGAWSTQICILNDGTFTGEYTDSNSESGKGYTSTVNICNFSGRFNNIKKVDSFTYYLKLSSLNYDKNIGKTFIKDGICYITSEPYGLETGTDFMLYLPGIATANLPESFLSWYSMGINTQTTLPIHGLYNITAEYGFYGDGAVYKRLFTDVNSKHYFYDAVNWAVKKGVTNGTGDNRFSPDTTCTRGQCATFLWRAAGSPEPSSITNTFNDIKNSDYYYKAILWAAEKGITYGTETNTFSPNSGCTRSQVVTFLWRAQNKPIAGTSNQFIDIQAGAYYVNAVFWAVEKGITNGTEVNIFSPNSICTRGQIATFLYRCYN